MRFDNPNIIIGIFDRDTEGIKSFRLDKNFIISKYHSEIKKHKNGKSYAILLPTPPGMEAFENVENLSIEFYFNEIDLKKEVNGKRLKLEFPNLETKYCGKTIKTTPATELQYAQIKRDSKVEFAETVVPSLEVASFNNFKHLFDLISIIISREKI